MSDKKIKAPLTAEESLRAAQQAALNAAMEQAQAMYGNILKQTGMDTEAMQDAYRQSLETAQQMMAQAMEAMPLGSAGYEGFADFGEDDGWEIVRKEDGSLSREQLYLLAFGAPLGVYNGDYVDSLESTADTDTLREMLESWWEVTDRKTALETIGWLLEEGQHADADPALAEVLSRGVENIPEEEKADEESKIGDVCAIAGFVLEAKGLSPGELPETVLGWDLVRAVNVARWTFLCGYIAEEEMWHAMREAVGRAKQLFGSWEVYGQSFAIGRGVWRGDTDDYETADEVVTTLLEDGESPWVQMEW